MGLRLLISPVFGYHKSTGNSERPKSSGAPGDRAWEGSPPPSRGGHAPQPSSLHARPIHAYARCAPDQCTIPPQPPSFHIPLGRSGAAHGRGSRGPADGRCMRGACRGACRLVRGGTLRGAGPAMTLIRGCLRGLYDEEVSRRQRGLQLAMKCSQYVSGNLTARS